MVIFKKLIAEYMFLIEVEMARQHIIWIVPWLFS